MKLLYTFAILLLVTACGTTVGVDYDRATDFSQYTSYNYYPNIASGLSELDEARIKMVTDSLLQQKGMVKSATPQLYVNFYANEQVAVNNSSIGIGIGGGGRNVAGGISGGIPIGGRKMEQRLTVDVIAVAKDELIFQAVAEGTYKEKITPAKKTQYYERVLSRLLDEFPPEK
jgi:hypothetical protein